MSRTTKWLIAVVIVVVGLGCLFGQKLWFVFATKGYQSVFLTNGQVYFGKLSVSGRFYKLTDIYYLQAPQDLQDQKGIANPQQNIKLVKLGNELHGPQDQMYIERDKVLFWENMKDDSKVVTAIKQNK